MRVAITGPGGFIGRHVVAAFEKRKASLTLVRRPGSRDAGRPATHAVVEMDLHAPPESAYDVMGRPDVLVHLAWGGLPNYGSAHHLEDELPAHAGFLEQVLEAGLPTLLVAGTCLEYGMQSGELHEGMPAAPTTAYGLAKDRLRMHLQLLQRRLRFNLTWARLFYLYGEGQAPSSLVPQLIAAIQRGDPVFNMSGGEQLRDYLSVEEAATVLVMLALNGRDNGIVNVCSGRPVRVREIVERIVEERHSSIRLNLGHFPYPEWEPMAFWGDRRRLDECLRGAA